MARELVGVALILIVIAYLGDRLRRPQRASGARSASATSTSPPRAGSGRQDVITVLFRDRDLSRVQPASPRRSTPAEAAAVPPGVLGAPPRRCFFHEAVRRRGGEVHRRRRGRAPSSTAAATSPTMRGVPSLRRARACAARVCRAGRWSTRTGPPHAVSASTAAEALVQRSGGRGARRLPAVGDTITRGARLFRRPAPVRRCADRRGGPSSGCRKTARVVSPARRPAGEGQDEAAGRLRPARLALLARGLRMQTNRPSRVDRPKG
jgi:hypothetical protein